MERLLFLEALKNFRYFALVVEEMVEQDVSIMAGRGQLQVQAGVEGVDILLHVNWL